MTTHTLDVPGATLTYDVRRSDAGAQPIRLWFDVVVQRVAAAVSR